jgi:L-asparaginase II
MPGLRTAASPTAASSSGSGGGGTGEVQTRSLAWVGRLQSGNRPGMTVAQEYHQKETLGKYSTNDHAVARMAGHKNARDYQAALTRDIGARGLINPPQYTANDRTLSEGYHRYAAMRQLGRRTMPVRKIHW